MLFSKTWLQTYIVETLPDDKTLEALITFNAFEVEEVTVENGHSIYDIKVLPNRAHDALAHRGMARDIAALLDFTFIDRAEYYNGGGDANVLVPVIIIEDEKACTLFASVRIDGVKVGESPVWLKEAMNAIGQRSINNIVDVTNFVQFSINKPMHAYDASLIKGGELRARFACAGEKLRTLDDKDLELREDTLVIADKDMPLGLAGIKGGKFSGVSLETTSLIIESANFNSSLIRKTSQKYGVRTDASKRFENGAADSLVEEGLRMTISLIQKLCPEAKVSNIVIEGKKKTWDYTTSVSVREVNSLLGTSYDKEEIQKVFERLGFHFEMASLRKMIEKRLTLTSEATYKRISSMREDAPTAFSCSSLMSFLFNGVWQPSISIDKYVFGEKIESKDMKWGDFVFSNTGEGCIYFESVQFLPGTKVESGIDHVGMYTGDGKVLHISKASNKVMEEKMSESSMFKGDLLYARMSDVDEERFFITVPHERLDIRIKEDVIEEIARVKGLSTIKGVLPDLKGRKGLPHKRLYYETKIKNILFENGFSEMYTYTFGDKGDVSIVKALMDKKKLRTNLMDGVKEALKMNSNNIPLLGVKEIRVFEFGNVFTKKNEKRHLCIGVTSQMKNGNIQSYSILLKIFTDIFQKLQPNGNLSNSFEPGQTEIFLKGEGVNFSENSGEIDFDALISILPEPTETCFLNNEIKEQGMNAVYSLVSSYPFIVRDVAVWVPKEIGFETLKASIEKILESDKGLLARPLELFDSFTKEDRTSYAFRLVIQSCVKTLTDVEANVVADKVYVYLKGEGFEVR